MSRAVGCVLQPTKSLPIRVSFKSLPTLVSEGARECAIADALALLGDRWSLLIARECSYGIQRFNDIQRNTGAPRNILAGRLKRLESAGVLRRELYSEHPQRYEYFLTDSGQELFPILLALREWGERRLHPGETPVNPVWHDGGAELHVESVCTHCHKVVRPDDLRYPEPASPERITAAPSPPEEPRTRDCRIRRIPAAGPGRPCVPALLRPRSARLTIASTADPGSCLPSLRRQRTRPPSRRARAWPDRGDDGAVRRV